MKKNQIELKNFKQITDIDELNQLMVGEDRNWCKWILSKYSIYKLVNEDKYIEIEKPEIRNTIYYDDEYESHDLTFENFVLYNECYFKDKELTGYEKSRKELKEYGCCIGGYLEKPTFCVAKKNNLFINFQDKAYYKLNEYRKLTNEEYEEYKQIIEHEKNMFKKRLETYWKRYSDKICTYGYWANR